MDIDTLIIGAGVVGLAIAAEISKRNNSVFVVEKHFRFGQETSSRNSEVIHSGIYYPKNSLKARLCVEGNKMLYDYCKEKEIWTNKCGKLVVATSKTESKHLDLIYRKAKENGVDDHKIIDYDEIRNKEPHIIALKAIYFPSTGVVDSGGLMHQLETDSINNGAQFVYGAEVIKIDKHKDFYVVTIIDADKYKYSFSCKTIINSAGLFAGNVSHLADIYENRYTIHYWKGEYFSVGNGKNKYVNSLIYPVPQADNVGLGIHATIDVNKRLKLGPNAIYLGKNKFDYYVNTKHKLDFYASAVKFLPFIELKDLSPDQAGVRPKLQKPGDNFRDFIIKNEKDKGYNGFINLIGIESPGLTSCLSIAKYVNKIISAD